MTPHDVERPVGEKKQDDRTKHPSGRREWRTTAVISLYTGGQPDITGAFPLQDTDVSASLYVANLPSFAKQAMLAGAFAEFGTVLSVQLKREAMTGSERFYGFVEMSTTAEARAAARALNATRFEGRLLSVWRVARS